MKLVFEKSESIWSVGIDVCVDYFVVVISFWFLCWNLSLYIRRSARG